MSSGMSGGFGGVSVGVDDPTAAAAAAAAAMPPLAFSSNVAGIEMPSHAHSQPFGAASLSLSLSSFGKDTYGDGDAAGGAGSSSENVEKTAFAAAVR